MTAAWKAAALALMIVAWSRGAAMGQVKSPATGGAAGKAMDAQYDRFSEAYRQLDPAIVGGLYAEDAFYLQPGSEIIRGRKAIHENFAGFFSGVAQRKDSVRIAFEIVDRAVSGDLGYDIGYYTLSSRTAAGESQSNRGKFTVIWKKGSDGIWQIHIDGYSGVGK